MMAERSFEERMLTCAFKTTENVEYSVFLSHAYASHQQMFVYVQDSGTTELFPENLTANVRLKFVSSRHYSAL